MSIQLMDCTLRDGANVVGKGFDKKVTYSILKGLVSSGVKIIEFGNAGGLGAYEVAGFTDALTDQEYFDIAKEFQGQGSELGMFLNAKRYRKEKISDAKQNSLDFLRVGADAGDYQITIEPIQEIKRQQMKAYYSFMKAYILTPEELAEEAKHLEEAGIDALTIMDSAGTMTPEEVDIYVRKLKETVTVPIGFHGHNNIGLAIANAIAAKNAGADFIDCGLMGMARSAGNIPTEICLGVFQREGLLEELDLYALFDYIDQELDPLMRDYNFKNPISVTDITLGISGAHSSFLKVFKTVAKEVEINLFELIIEVSKINQKNPNEDLIRKVANDLKTK